MRRVIARVSTVLLCLLSATALHAQPAPSSAVTAVPRLVRVTSTFVPANGRPAAPVEAVTMAIYAEETGGAPLWQETQYVAVDADGRYTVLLGATLTDGLPLDLFGSGDARWLGRRFERPGEGEQARVLLASVPYALKASDADTLGGRPPSAYLLAAPGASAGAGATGAGAAGTAKTSSGSVVPALSAGTANFVGKFVDTTDLGNSAIYEAGGLVGVNTTTPFDVVHARFTNTAGTMTGYAVQNLGSTGYSGMLFYDQTGALGQFQGFNNSTHEYRINNIASSGSINFMIGSSSKFNVANNGFIGIGTTGPTGKLQVNGGVRARGGAPGGFGVNDNGYAFTGGGGDDDSGMFSSADGQLEFYTNNNEIMRLTPAGRVGIGTSTPGVALDVVGGGTVNNAAPASYFYPTGGLVTGYTGIFSPVSIRASGQIVANLFGAVSDERIKNIQGRSNSAADLRKLLGIEVTDFLFKDVVEKGSRPQKKVIAQQVEKVFPEAVSNATDVVPDIYQKAPINNGWVALATDLKVGDRVRLVTEKGHRAVHEVLEAKKDKFRTDFAEDAGQVFVYGREVKDFRVVDYEAIAMLNVSATQEMNRRMEKQAEEISQQATRIAELETQASEVALLRRQIADLQAAVRTSGRLESTRLATAK